MPSKIKTAAILALVLLSIFSIVKVSNALPSGATVANITTVGEPYRTPGNRTDPRGTITTIAISTIQQDQFWKAYVGNITGRLTLDNPSGMTIYEWGVSSVNKSGKVYVARNSSVDFSTVICANAGNISNEHLFYNMTDTQGDNINKTFNVSSHSQFYVGTINFPIDSCTKTTATYVNDTAQTLNGNQKFQEIVLQDASNSMIYMTILSSATGYDGNSYDFQLIVPESGIRVTPTTYYFFTELSG